MNVKEKMELPFKDFSLNSLQFSKIVDHRRKLLRRICQFFSENDTATVLDFIFSILARTRKNSL